MLHLVHPCSELPISCDLRGCGHNKRQPCARQKKNSSRKGRETEAVAPPSSVVEEGRSHSPARRSSLRSERTRAQLLTARQKGQQIFALALSLGARFSPSFCLGYFCFYADITTRKTNVVYFDYFDLENERARAAQQANTTTIFFFCTWGGRRTMTWHDVDGKTSQLLAERHPSAHRALAMSTDAESHGVWLPPPPPPECERKPPA